MDVQAELEATRALYSDIARAIECDDEQLLLELDQRFQVTLNTIFEFETDDPDAKSELAKFFLGILRPMDRRSVLEQKAAERLLSLIV